MSANRYLHRNMTEFASGLCEGYSTYEAATLANYPEDVREALARDPRIRHGLLAFALIVNSALVDALADTVADAEVVRPVAPKSNVVPFPAKQ